MLLDVTKQVEGTRSARWAMRRHGRSRASSVTIGRRSSAGSTSSRATHTGPHRSSSRPNRNWEAAEPGTGRRLPMPKDRPDITGMDEQLKQMQDQMQAMMPKEFAGMANLMAHPVAAMAAGSAIGMAFAGQAFGLWVGCCRAVWKRRRSRSATIRRVVIRKHFAPSRLRLPGRRPRPGH